MGRRTSRRGALRLLGGLVGGIGAGTFDVDGVDDIDDVAGELLEGSIVVFETPDAVDELDRFDLLYRAFEVLPMAYVRAPPSVLDVVEELGVVRQVVPNRRLEWYNDGVRASMDVGDVGGDDVTYDGSGVHAAVVDSGIDPLHPDHDQVANNYQWVGNPIGEPTFFVPTGPVDTDEIGHGTHVAGTLAGNGSASDGEYRGVAPETTVTSYSTGLTVTVLKSAAAFDHLLANHADEVDLVSNSYGTTGGAAFDPEDPVTIASYEAYETGILPAFAAGNAGPSNGTLSAFAKAPHVLTVGATDGEGPVASFSSRGTASSSANHDRDEALHNLEAYYETGEADGPLALHRPTVCAPGVGVTSTTSAADLLGVTQLDLAGVEPYYSTLEGTSMACPAAAGVAALAIQAARESAGENPSPMDVIDEMERTATALEGDPAATGAGLVDAPALVDAYD